MVAGSGRARIQRPDSGSRKHQSSTRGIRGLSPRPLLARLPARPPRAMANSTRCADARSYLDEAFTGSNEGPVSTRRGVRAHRSRARILSQGAAQASSVALPVAVVVADALFCDLFEPPRVVVSAFTFTTTGMSEQNTNGES